jgi:hypothetical protein
MWAVKNIPKRSGTTIMFRGTGDASVAYSARLTSLMKMWTDVSGGVLLPPAVLAGRVSMGA